MIHLSLSPWTAGPHAKMSYLALIAHYIDTEFKIKSLLLEVDIYDEKHTSANLAEKLRNIIADWHLEESKILIAIRDNAANIKEAIQDDLQWPFWGCYAHNIN